MIEYSDMIEEGSKSNIDKRKEIRIKAKQELTFKKSTLGKILRHAEDERRRQVS